jgi:tetratricopeptide (TPR) repeat protein
MWRIYTGNPWALDEWEREARNTISLLEAEHDREGLLRVWELIAVSAAGQARYEQAERAAEQAIAYAQSLGRPGVFELHMGLAFGPRPADEALQRLEALLKDDPNPHPVLTQAWLLAMLGRSDEAWAIGLAAAKQMRELTGQEVSRLAEIAVLAGDHERAVAELRLFCDDLRSRGDLAGLSTYAPKLGRSLCKLGRYDEAESLARVGQELGDERDVATQALWRQVQALVHSHRGQQEEAERLAQEAVEIAGGTDDLNSQGDTLTDLAEVLERAGQYHEAQQALKQALDRYDRKKNVAMVAQVTQRLGEHEHSARSV